MLKNVIGDRMLRADRGSQHKRNLVLPHDITGALSYTGFRSAIGQWLKAERTLIKMRRLLRVADVKFNVICALERQKILSERSCGFVFGSSNCRWHNTS